jgi:multidrug resistance efflux pump
MRLAWYNITHDRMRFAVTAAAQLARISKLYDAQEVSRLSFEEARRDQEVAQAQYQQAQRNQELVNAGPVPEAHSEAGVSRAWSPAWRMSWAANRSRPAIQRKRPTATFWK